MRYIFNFPDIGEGLDEGLILEWYVKTGQAVKVGDALVKVETDKVVADIPSPREGVITALYGKTGETIHVGNALAEIEIEGVHGSDAQELVIEDKLKTEAVEEEGAGVVGTLEVAGNNAFMPSSNEGFEQVQVELSVGKKKALATPVARAIAKEFDLDINNVTGTGPGGRVMKEDIHNYHKNLAYKSQPISTQTEQANETSEVEIQNLTQIRKTIAKNMINSKQNAAHITVFDDVEVAELIRIRNKFKQRLADENIKLSYLPFVIKASALALKKHKLLNSEMDLEQGKLIIKNYINIGIAVDTDDGLLVPVIKNADKKSIKELALEVSQISEKARNRSIKIEDMKDGTFTITSFGSIGGKYATPIINYPQAAILGIGRIYETPVVKNGEIRIGNLMPLSLAVDHRIVDGGEVSRFLNDILEYLGEPSLLILE